MALIERVVARIRTLKVGGLPLTVAPLQAVAQESAADPSPLAGGLHGQLEKVVVRGGGMLGVERDHGWEDPRRSPEADSAEEGGQPPDLLQTTLPPLARRRPGGRTPVVIRDEDMAMRDGELEREPEIRGQGSGAAPVLPQHPVGHRVGVESAAQ